MCSRFRHRRFPSALFTAALLVASLAQAEPPTPLSDTLEEVIVNVTPVMGTGVPLSQVPSNVQTMRVAQFDRDDAQTLPDAIERHLSSVTLVDTEGNPLQQDLVSRGFTASPVLGTPQGLALYQNGVRVNEAFGDVVLWDFIPVFAIEELQELPGSNPIFGLNALGGAITLKMKDGFGYQGTTAEVAAGSFGRYRGTLQAGTTAGDCAFYFGTNASHDDGWREHSASDLVQAFADSALRGDDYTLGTSLTLAWGHLNGNGAVPAQDNPTAAFAVPDLEIDHLVFLQVRGNKTLTAALSLQGTAYLRDMSSEIQNGAASGFAPCGDTVCDDGEPLTSLNGAPIPFNAPYTGILPISTTRTRGSGGSVQLALNTPIAGLHNIAQTGVTYDQGLTSFRSVTLLGNLVYLTPPGTTTEANGPAIGGTDYNVHLDTVNRYAGVFVTDTVSLTEALSAMLAARYNDAQIRLTDLYGAALNGEHDYARLNRSAGVTYQFHPNLNIYASYSESNRIPSAAELSCANPSRPCTFPLGFISDPPLSQVIARTVELGARGQMSDGDLTLHGSADLYGTRNDNDILFVSAGPLLGSGYFKNAGATRRVGAEFALEGEWRHFDVHASYGWVRATFESRFTMISADNPGANTNGEIFVQPGDRLPEVPLQTGKIGFSYQFAHTVHAGLDLNAISNQYLRGDEANLQPPLPGYAWLNAHASWQASPKMALFLQGENVLDRRAASFGLYSDPTGNGAFPGFTNPRFYTPRQPFGLWGGIRIAL